MSKNKGTLIVKNNQDNVPEVFVYGVICEEMANAFVQQLAVLAGIHDLVNVRVNTKGGSVYDGIAMFNAINNAKCAIDIYIDGIAASMGSAFIQAGRKRYASKYARIMAHKPGGGAVGNADDLRRAAEEIDACEAVLLDMYVVKTGKNADAVKAEFLNGKDNYFSATEAKSAGLIDDIYDGEDIGLGVTAQAEDIYNAVQVTVFASLNDLNQNESMKQVIMPLAVWAKLQTITAMSDTASEHEITAAFNKVFDKAAAHDTMKAQLTNAQTEIADIKKDSVAKEVSAHLEEAFKAKKITALEKTQLAEDYADKPERLKTLLASKGGFTPIGNLLKQEDRNTVVTAEIQALVGKGWDALMQSGEMATVKAASNEAYLALYEKKHGCLPNEGAGLKK